MQELRTAKKQVIAAAILLGALLALAATELMCAAVREWWTKRPVTAAFVTGGLLLGITALVVDAETRRRQQLRVSRVLETARTDFIRNLNTAMFDLRNALDGLVEKGTYDEPPDAVRRRLERALAEEETAFKLVDELEGNFDQMGQPVALWAPTLLPFEAHSEALDAYAKAAFFIGKMWRTIKAEQILIKVAGEHGVDPGPLRTADWRGDTLAAYDQFVAAARDFERAAGEQRLRWS